MFRNIFPKSNLSINQFLNQLILFHHYNEFLILYEIVRRFLNILQMSSFHNKIKIT